MNYFFDWSCLDESKGSNALFAIMGVAGLLVSVCSFLADNLGRKRALALTSLVASVGCLVSLLRESTWFIVLGLIVQTTCRLDRVRPGR